MNRKQDVDTLVSLFSDQLESSYDNVEPAWLSFSIFSHNNSAMDDLAQTILSYNKPNQCDEIMKYMSQQLRYKYGFNANFSYTFDPMRENVYIACENILQEAYAQ